MKLNPQVCFQLKILKLCSNCDFLINDHFTMGKKKIGALLQENFSFWNTNFHFSAKLA